MFWPIKMGMSDVVISVSTLQKAGEVSSPKVMSQVSLPRIEMFPPIPLTRMLDLDMCLLASSGKREMGMMQVVHPESNMPTPENVMPLLRRLIWTRGDRRSGRIWKLNVWWCWVDTWTWEWVITSRSVPNENPVRRSASRVHGCADCYLFQVNRCQWSLCVLEHEGGENMGTCCP